MNRALLVAAVLMMSLESVAWAHPGHGSDDGGYGLGHYLTEPRHLASIVGLFVLCLVVMKFLSRVMPRFSQVRQRKAA